MGSFSRGNIPFASAILISVCMKKRSILLGLESVNALVHGVFTSNWLEGKD